MTFKLAIVLLALCLVFQVHAVFHAKKRHSAMGTLGKEVAPVLHTAPDAFDKDVVSPAPRQSMLSLQPLARTAPTNSLAVNWLP
jgi:hypothetical protein